MKRFVIGSVSVLAAALLLQATPARAANETQGQPLQGFALDGIGVAGLEVLVRVGYAGMQKNGQPLRDVQVVKGELRGAQGATPLAGAGFAGVTLQGSASVGIGKPTPIDLRITSVAPEAGANEPAGLPAAARGGTFLYTLEYRLPGAGAAAGWKNACAADASGAALAIPVQGTWQRDGRRVDGQKHFTFSCTKGAVARCYRQGYRPWFQQAGKRDLFRGAHDACVRMVRADYCGDGLSQSRAGTKIFLRDSLKPSVLGALAQPAAMKFEAGWGACGAVCLARWRWPMVRQVCLSSSGCLYRNMKMGKASMLVANVCDTKAEAEKLGRELNTDVYGFSHSGREGGVTPRRGAHKRPRGPQSVTRRKARAAVKK